MPKVRRLRQIYRIDYPPRRDHAWIVQWRHRGQITISRRFSDGRYGGKRQALAAAIQFRDIALPKREALRYEHWRRGRKRSHNTSGIIGVGRYESLSYNKRYVSVYWLASWNDLTGKRHQRRFSVKLHGEHRAKALACRAREEAMRTMFVSCD